ncbi:hypothetical protein SAMN05421720_110122 [Rhodospira trueperi]|uniref:Uncharacterized protein n=1 Tax=Rhodospira trueperi TaxID=69960 RepID=A0A1G7F5T5_9PROT|nr:hypothetical protein SAMN05421720_110122 [Rhodospira trueperi]
MRPNDFGLYGSKSVSWASRDAESGDDGSSSDHDLVYRVHQLALRHGESERRAWRAAVGAYLERHPSASVTMAERVVTCLIRQRLDDLPTIKTA